MTSSKGNTSFCASQSSSFNNLISNAVKFTDAGVVTVILQRGNKAAEGWEYKLSVTDTGIGIEPEDFDLEQTVYVNDSQELPSESADPDLEQSDELLSA